MEQYSGSFLLVFVWILTFAVASNIDAKAVRQRRYATPPIPPTRRIVIDNATSLLCHQAPTARRLPLTNAQLLQMFKDKGGAYIREYMAVSKDETEYFTDMLTMVVPQKAGLPGGMQPTPAPVVGVAPTAAPALAPGATPTAVPHGHPQYAQTTVHSFGNGGAMGGAGKETGFGPGGFTDPFSQWNLINYMAKKTLMDDLRKLHFWFKNTTNVEKYFTSSTPTSTRSATPTAFRSTSTISTNTTQLPLQESTTSFPSKPDFKTPVPTSKAALQSSADASTSSTASSLPNKLDFKTTEVTYSETGSTNSRDYITAQAKQTRKRTNVVSPKTQVPTTNQQFVSQSTTATLSTTEPTKSIPVNKTPKSMEELMFEFNRMLVENDITFAKLAGIWKDANLTTHPAILTQIVPPERKRKKRNAYGSVSRVNYCRRKGSVTDDGFLHMCSTCAATTTLPDDFFPRYINEAICQTDDKSCLTVAGTPHGLCKQKTFSLRMMRKKPKGCLFLVENGQNFVIDDWELYTQQINVCCECTINKLSLFSKYIKPMPGMPVG